MPLLLHKSVRELAQGYVFSLDIEPTGDIIKLDCEKALLNVSLCQNGKTMNMSINRMFKTKYQLEPYPQYSKKNPNYRIMICSRL